MRSGLRTGIAAAVLIAMAYGAVGAPVAAEEPPAAASENIRTKLPGQMPWDLVVDDAHQQVFVNVTSDLVIAGFDGQVKRTIAGDYLGDMTLAEGGDAVYIAQYSFSGDSIVRVDTETHATSRIGLPADTCLNSLTYTGGKVWFSHGSCRDTPPSLGWYDPATRQLRTGVTTTPAAGERLRALPDRPDRLALVGKTQFLGVYDVSSGTPTVVAESTEYPSERHCVDAALAADGDLLVTACQSGNERHVFATADLSVRESFPSGDGNAVAVTPDGRYVAVGRAVSSGPRIHVYDIEDGTPGTFGRSYEFAEGYMQFSGLGFSATGTLFAVEHVGADGSNYLNVFKDATKHLTTVTLDAPKTVDYQGDVDVTGKLSYAPGVATTATLTREDRVGVRDLGTISIDPDGTFSFRDTPRVTGPQTYTVEFPGDATHPAATGTGTTVMRPLPYDINADGHAETVVGAPGESIGADSRTGMFHVLPGGPSGASGSGSKSYHQGTPGVPGSNEDGDRFGYANTSGDFDADGYADVAVSAPRKNLDNGKPAVDAGAVWFFFGSSNGLRTNNVKVLSPHSGVYGNNAEFGTSLAAGDFNNDGRDDLAIGTPGKDGGYAVVWNSISSGTWYTTLSQKGTLPGTPDDGDRFGSSVSAGDVNQDGYDDLAVGASHDREDLGRPTGSASVFYGTANSLTGEGAQRWSKQTPDVPGDAGTDSATESSDQFGSQVALADFNGDGAADLAVGAPGAPVPVDGVRKPDAGTVTALYSSEGRISTAGAVEVTQDTTGMPGSPGKQDRLGAALAAGDADGDGAAELAVFSPGDTYVTVIPGGTGGLSYADAAGWTQNTSGIPGASESGDLWGSSLRFAPITGAANDCLIVGAPGENDGRGAITVIYGGASGLTTADADYYSQATTGISGDPEPSDGFGSS